MNTEGRTEGDSSSSNFQIRHLPAMYPELFEDDPVFKYLRETAKRGERERLRHMSKPVETTKIPVGQIVEQEVTINGNVELQRIYVPDPKVRETMEYMVQIAWERQSSNQPLRSQDRTAIDYYNVVLRHLPQPINGPNQPVLPHLQQSNYHAPNEPRWLQNLTNRWIRNVEATMTNIRRENLEFGEDSPENTQLCCICLENFAAGEEIERLDCAHRFHMSCIKDWLLAVKNVCPLCNKRGYHFN